MEKHELFNKRWEFMKVIEETIKTFSVGEIFDVSKYIPSQLYATLESGNIATLGKIFSDLVKKGHFPNVTRVRKGTSGSLRDVWLYKKIKD